MPNNAQLRERLVTASPTEDDLYDPRHNGAIVFNLHTVAPLLGSYLDAVDRAKFRQTCKGINKNSAFATPTLIRDFVRCENAVDFLNLQRSSAAIYTASKKLPAVLIKNLLSGYSFDHIDNMVVSNIHWMPLAEEAYKHKVRKAYFKALIGKDRNYITKCHVASICLLIFLALSTSIMALGLSTSIDPSFSYGYTAAGLVVAVSVNMWAAYKALSLTRDYVDKRLIASFETSSTPWGAMSVYKLNLNQLIKMLILIGFAAILMLAVGIVTMVLANFSSTGCASTLSLSIIMLTFLSSALLTASKLGCFSSIYHDVLNNYIAQARAARVSDLSLESLDRCFNPWRGPRDIEAGLARETIVAARLAIIFGVNPERVRIGTEAELARGRLALILPAIGRDDPIAPIAP